MVQLNSGDSAIVIRIDSHMQRPIVRILATEQEISLADNPTVMITRVINVNSDEEGSNNGS